MDDYNKKIFEWLADLQTKHVNEIEAKGIDFEAEKQLKFTNPIYLN